MANLTAREKIDKFMELAKLSGLTPLIVGSDHIDYMERLRYNYGLKRCEYFATVAALGSIIVKMMMEFEEEGRQHLIPQYEYAIKNWNEAALAHIDDLTDYVIGCGVGNKEEYYRAIGGWILIKIKGEYIENEEQDVAEYLGYMIRENMELVYRY